VLISADGAVLMNAGVQGYPAFTRVRTAEGTKAGHGSLKHLRQAAERGRAMETLTCDTSRLAEQLHAERKIDAPAPV
jgi:hypothetical protein